MCPPAAAASHVAPATATAPPLLRPRSSTCWTSAPCPSEWAGAGGRVRACRAPVLLPAFASHVHPTDPILTPSPIPLFVLCSQGFNLATPSYPPPQVPGLQQPQGLLPHHGDKAQRRLRQRAVPPETGGRGRESEREREREREGERGRREVQARRLPREAGAGRAGAGWMASILHMCTCVFVCTCVCVYVYVCTCMCCGPH